MSRPKLPARLYFDETDQVWCIRDGSHKKRTGCGKSEREAAERQLEVYLLTKRSKESIPKNRRADQISCAEVLARYAERAKVARPKELGQRIDVLLDFWGERMLDYVDEDSCEDFADHVGSDSRARRCLEDFRSAVSGYQRAGYLREHVRFTLPPKPTPRTDWLTHAEVEALCTTAWNYREIQKGVETKKFPTRHVDTFIRVAVSTASRSARVYRATYKAEPGRPWLDLERGMFHRSWAGERVADNKRAPPVPLGETILTYLRARAAEGETGVCPGDPKKAFARTLERARAAYPALFLRDDGEPKHIVRHTLRHTGITHMAIAGVDPYEICKWAGITMEVFEGVYAHHHPKFMSGILAAQRLPEAPPGDAPADRNGQKPPETDRNRGKKEACERA